MPDDEGDRDDDEFQPIMPEGTEFENPVASGAQFLFGGAVSGGQEQNGAENGQGTDVTGLFIG